MGLIERLNLTVRADLNEIIKNTENPEMVLEEAINHIQEVLIQTKVAIAKVESIPNQKAKLNYEVAMAEVTKWQENLRKAQRAENERLTFYASERLKNHKASARIAKSKVEENTHQATELRQNLISLNKKLEKAKAMRSMLKSNPLLPDLSVNNNLDNSALKTRLEKVELELEAVKYQLIKQQQTTKKLIKTNATALQEIKYLLTELNSYGDKRTSEQLLNRIDRENISSTVQTENKGLDVYEKPSVRCEIEEKDIEQFFAMMESSNEVDDDLATRKTELTDMFVSQQSQLDSENKTSLSESGSTVDNELEALRKQIENLS